MKVILILIAMVLFQVSSMAQKFEEPKLTNQSNKVKVHIGADFAMQYQALNNQASGAELMPLGSNLNLPTANFTINADLAPGMRVSLITYLSSRHHNDTWVKGGYLLIDQLPFLSPTSHLMDNLTAKVGVMEVNYGDGHFRRSDNGNIIRNPFVGNYIMDAFTTAPALELMYRKNGFILMGGTTTGNLKPQLTGYTNGHFVEYNLVNDLGVYGKIGFDKQINSQLRVRVTASPWFHSTNQGGSLYFGDRAGSRFYNVMKLASEGSAATDITSGHTSGRWGPGFYTKDHSLMLNTFIKYSGLEFFGLYEIANGKASGSDYNFRQFDAEGVYRFGNNENFYLGVKYNTVNNDQPSNPSISRVELGGGYFLTKNVVTKLIYVDQNYKNFAQYGKTAGFQGMMLEAGISF